MLSYIIGFLLVGGFYDFSISAIGICIMVELLVHYHNKRPVWQKQKNYFLYIPMVFVFWMVLASFWALDRRENILGILRGVVILVWMYRCFLMEESEKQKILQMIPYLGAGMVVISIVSLIHDDLASHFWQARRLGGFFQYSNTCALFLLMGIVILVQQLIQKQNSEKISLAITMKTIFIKENLVTIAVFCVLLLGIFLTGSRSVLLLLLLWGAYRAFRVKQLRLPFALIAVVGLGGAFLYGKLAGDEQNIARIFTIFRSNSTILGRILYNVDAFSIVKEYPLGLGYRGYYYIQPAVQTGVYTTRFVHNDLVQILVDYGLVAFALFLVYVIWQLVKGKQKSSQKELLILILVASLVDFHMQYMCILMLVVLCLDLGQREKQKKQKELKENSFFAIAGIVIFSYLTIAFGAHYLGNYNLTLTLFPGYTEAQIKQLNACADKDEAVAYANEILSHNEYVSEAYHTKVYASAMEGDFVATIEAMEQSLALRRYDVLTYQAYDELLSELIVLCKNMEWTKQEEQLRAYQEYLPQKLTDLRQDTHPLAFKLRDVPVFEW